MTTVNHAVDDNQIAKSTRNSSTKEGPQNALGQLKPCQLLHSGMNKKHSYCRGTARHAI